MVQALQYGVWLDQTVDHRPAGGGPLPAGLSTERLPKTGDGNPLLGLVAPQGFLVFDAKLPLLKLMLDYWRRVTALSCGRCTPCRAGTLEVLDALETLREGGAIDWAELEATLEDMSRTSLCGIGIASPEPLLAALRRFRSDLLPYSDDAPGVLFADATAPCIEACPAHVNIPRYIDGVRDGRADISEAVLLDHYPLVASCGRVCVRPCESACVRGRVDRAIAIRDLKRAAAAAAPGAGPEYFACAKKAPRGADGRARVAVVGAGPAGLNCAYHLLRRGVSVDVFEMEAAAGGMARYGIPAYRLPNAILEKEASTVETLGGRFLFGRRLGRDFTTSSLLAEGYEAVFLGIGCGIGKPMGVPGEEKAVSGVLKGLDFLLPLARRQEAGEAEPLEGDTVVVGCGNVAMDCCRSARRLSSPDAKVTVVYRRTRASAPADPEEIDAALEERVGFEFLTNPVEILTEAGRVVGVKVVRMAEGAPDASGRRSVKPVAGSEFVIPCSRVIGAIGQAVDPTSIAGEEALKMTRWGTIETNAAMATSIDRVFAGGDAAAGPATLILAMAEGERAAQSIAARLEGLRPVESPREALSNWILGEGLLGHCVPPRPTPEAPRSKAPHLAPDVRARSWDEAEGTLSKSAAEREASRCLRCYRVFALETLAPVGAREKI